MPGDDFLRAFPNISPIRGARPRTPEDWIASLEKMIELGPEDVVPSHTRPVLGGAAARAAGIESGRSYDVNPVTGRFLLVRPADSGPSPRAVRMVLNWALDLPTR